MEPTAITVVDPLEAQRLVNLGHLLQGRRRSRRARVALQVAIGLFVGFSAYMTIRTRFYPEPEGIRLEWITGQASDEEIVVDDKWCRDGAGLVPCSNAKAVR